MKLEVSIDWKDPCHWRKDGQPKISYGSLETATSAALEMEAKTRYRFSAYQCPICGRFHIGRSVFGRAVVPTGR